jgi:integrase
MAAKRKKASNGDGAFERRTGNVAWVRVSMPCLPGEKAERKRVPIDGSENMTDAQAKKAAVRTAAHVRAGRIVYDGKPRAGVSIAPTSLLTVRQLGVQWTSGELFKTYGRVNRLRVKATAKTDGYVLGKHVYAVKTRGAGGPDFGDVRVSDVTSDDITAVMGSLPAELSAKTRLEVYVLLRRLFDLAIFPAKLRKEGSNPVSRYVRPELDPEKLYCFIYPSELLALLRGTNAKGEIVVPLGRRVLYAVATYTGQRKASLYALQWGHVDFQHGTLASFRTKTRRAQYFVADPGLMEVLRLWHEFRDKPAADQPIVRDEDVDYDPRRLATALRDDLKAVGVTRAILFEENEPTVEPLRFHDLRSTFCTWARRLGRSDMWISERTGHEVSGDMINRYDRGAQTLQDLDYEPFPSIAGAVPELAALDIALDTGAARASSTTETAPTDDVVTEPYDPSQVPGTVRDRGVGGSNPLAPTRHAAGVPFGARAF